MKHQPLHLPGTVLTALAMTVTGSALAAEPEFVDEARNVYIPAQDERLRTLRVGAVYNDEHIQIRYEFETDNPSWYHQYWIFEDGEWVRYGRGSPGPDPHGLYEDRISMMLDDGSVPHFGEHGAYMTVHEGMRTLTNAADGEAVRAHPVLGEEMGRSDVRKYLPGSRNAVDAEVSWDKLKSDEEIQALREQGYFLDLWQWRAHRSHPVGHADNNYVLHYRLNSEGQGPFTDNWDDKAERPAWMFNPGITGFKAMDRQRLMDRDYAQDDWYYLSEEIAVPFDPNHDWQEGDVLPQRFLRQPTGSRGAIAAAGGYEEGAWRIRLTRTLEAPNPLDSKSLEDGGRYQVAFAVHTNASGARWHLVSHPQTLGLGVDDADIVAQRVEGDLDSTEVDWTELQVYYPGQITWQWLNRDDHPGREAIEEGEIGIREIHLTLEEIAAFSVAFERQQLVVQPEDDDREEDRD
ncbi:ethylbenzene dehydrogenase-related protein [Ectothiorhodospira shaposhnikovii]|uniref:ethylbenzene dehydrogenase-related protein n=1 Tax=Ectothiorhodospira shaposhnikovii TaxID=1054 RepID=UPI003B82D494